MADSDLEKEANDRLAECRTQKSQVEMDMRECYFFSAPRRARMVTSTTKLPPSRIKDETLLQTSLAFELVQDFVTVVMNAFMPEANPWCERRAGALVPEDAWKQVEKQVREDDLKIFAAMKASHLYAELAKTFYPDLGIGNVGIWIHNPRPAENFVNAAIPLREMEVNLGPFGELDDRFVVRHTKNKFLKALVPEVNFDSFPDIKEQIEKQPHADTEVRWGYWRLWDRRDDEVWQHVILVKNKKVHDAVLVGEGSCPLIVGRFNASPDWPYADGPLLQALPDLRQVDELEGQKVSHVELSLTPPLTYPDDSFAAVEQGIQPGAAYPIRSGTEGAVKAMYTPGPADAGLYEMSDKERRLRRMFFVDFPDQQGKTPPTATQWLDEMELAQRRIGTPGKSFFREVAAKIFLRYKYLLEKAGTIKPATVNGKHISLQAYNPAERSSEQQEVSMAVRTIEICGQAFPEEFKIKVDGGKTIENIVEVMRTDKIIAFRDPNQVQTAVDQISKLVGGRQVPGGDPDAAAGAGIA
jgi:hypothetical protein